jgi:two-component system phosphate regulon response regulator PhoB
MLQNRLPFVLAFEDNPFDQELIQAALCKKFNVKCVKNSRDYDTEMKVVRPDLVLIDILLEDEDGFDLFKKLKSDRATSNIPVFFLTGRRERHDKLSALALGAEDYIVKPFDVDELSLRISNRLKNLFSVNHVAEVQSGSVLIDLMKQRVYFLSGQHREPIHVTPIEFKLLHLFIQNEGCQFTRDTLRKEIWGNNVFISERTIDTHIKNLRHKLKSEGKKILSVHGIGFTWSEK